MDPTLAAAVHKENQHIGRGKATVSMKPDKLKTAGQERKALADITRVSKGANLKSKSALLASIEDRADQILTDEEIKQCDEWAKNGIMEMGIYSWSAKDEENLIMNQMTSSICLLIEELEQFTSDEEGYEIDESDLNVSISVPGRLSSIYTLEELDDLEEYPFPELKLDDD